MPKVKVVDGKIVLEDNLVVRAPDKPDHNSLELADPLPEFINSATFSKRSKSRRWKPEETVKFYSAIRKYGTDFMLISKLFPARTRNQIRSKFKREEKNNPTLIEFALTNRIPFGIYFFN